MKQMSLHFKRLLGTLQMRTTCATCDDLFKHSTNSIGSNYQGERLIICSMVIQTPKRDHHGATVTRRNFSHGICFRTFETFSRKGKINHISGKKKLRDLVALLPSHENSQSQSTRGSTNVLYTKRNIGLIESTSLVLPIWWEFSMQIILGHM